MGNFLANQARVSFAEWRQPHGRFGGSMPLAVALFALSLSNTGCSGSQAGVASDETRSLAEYDLAKDSYARGDLRVSLEHVEASLDLDGSNAEAAYLGAIIMVTFCARDEASSDCRFEEAEAYARKALEIDEQMRDAKNTLGVILIHQGKVDEAIEVLQPLSKDILYNSPEKAWGNLGWAFLERGSYDEAIDALQRAIAVQPMFCVGHYRIGVAYEQKNELQAALDSYTQAVETDRPECSRLQDAFFARARVLGKRDEAEAMRADLERCVELSQKTPVGKQCAARLKTLQ